MLFCFHFSCEDGGGILLLSNTSADPSAADPLECDYVNKVIININNFYALEVKLVRLMTEQIDGQKWEN